jgi:hypothetical protein
MDKPEGFFFENDNEEEIERDLELSNLMNEEDFEEDFIPEESEPTSVEELQKQKDLLQMLVYNKDRIINSQLSHLEMLEKENQALQDQYQMLYSAYTKISEKAKDMFKREKVLTLFLKKKKFKIADIDEFINEIRVKDYYKNKKQ